MRKLRIDLSSNGSPASSARRKIEMAYATYMRLPKDALVISDFMCVTFIANLIFFEQGGDPFWGAVIGPQGSGKTEALITPLGMEGVHWMDEVNSTAFISHLCKAKGMKDDVSLLIELNENWAIMEDFSGISHKRSEELDVMLSMFRRLAGGTSDVT